MSRWGTELGAGAAGVCAAAGKNANAITTVASSGSTTYLRMVLLSNLCGRRNLPGFPCPNTGSGLAEDAFVIGLADFQVCVRPQQRPQRPVIAKGLEILLLIFRRQRISAEKEPVGITIHEIRRDFQRIGRSHHVLRDFV